MIPLSDELSAQVESPFFLKNSGGEVEVTQRGRSSSPDLQQIAHRRAGEEALT